MGSQNREIWTPQSVSRFLLSPTSTHMHGESESRDLDTAICVSIFAFPDLHAYAWGVRIARSGHRNLCLDFCFPRSPCICMGSQNREIWTLQSVPRFLLSPASTHMHGESESRNLDTAICASIFAFPDLHAYAWGVRIAKSGHCNLCLDFCFPRSPRICMGSQNREIWTLQSVPRFLLSPIST